MSDTQATEQIGLPSGSWLTVDLRAVRHNIEALRRHLPAQTRLMGIVKANAYGTDSLAMARYLQTLGVEILGTAYVDEAIALRRGGIEQPLFVINAALHEVAKVVQWGLEVSVSHEQMIDSLSLAAKAHKKRVAVHLMVDTGMSRFGCKQGEALPLARRIASSPYLLLEGIHTHFASADVPAQDPFTLDQIAKFTATLEDLKKEGLTPTWRHAANSPGALRFSLPDCNMVRVGLAMYGIHPCAETLRVIDLEPALTLTSRIVSLKICSKGDTVSYGRSYTVEKEHATIAVLPIGYFDGLHRMYSGKSYVLIRGQTAPLVGKICMDYLMVDVSNIACVAEGDPAIIFGKDPHGRMIAPEDISHRGGTDVRELITCLGPRIERVFLED